MKKIPEITFSGSEAVRRGQVVNYITERCVFSLTDKGLELVEVAPGIDVQKQILDLMDFKPVYDPKKVRVMNTSIFRPELMGLKESIFGFKVDSRLSYNEERNTLFINLQNVSITMPSDIRAIQEGVERVIVDQCHGKKPDVVVNYDGFDCRDELVPEYRKMTVDLEKKYATVRRYCSRTFTRHQLATELKVKPRHVTPRARSSHCARSADTKSAARHSRTRLQRWTRTTTASSARMSSSPLFRSCNRRVLKHSRQSKDVLA